MGPNLCLLVSQIVAGIIVSPVLLIGSAYLLIWCHSVGAALFLLVSGILSFAGLFLNVLLFRQKLDEWYDPPALDSMKLLSILSASAAIVSLGFHVAKAIRTHDDVSLDSYYFSSASSGLALLLSLWFYSLCRWNRRFIELCDPLLSRPPPEPWRPTGMG